MCSIGMTENKHRCPAVFAPTENQKYQCMLPDGHEESHMWFVTWGGEHEGDVMQ